MLEALTDAFSCKRRGFLPVLYRTPMNETAALAERHLVLPEDVSRVAPCATASIIDGFNHGGVTNPISTWPPAMLVRFGGVELCAPA